jgi:hypothetical protein
MYWTPTWHLYLVGRREQQLLALTRFSKPALVDGGSASKGQRMNECRSPGRNNEKYRDLSRPIDPHTPY